MASAGKKSEESDVFARQLEKRPAGRGKRVLKFFGLVVLAGVALVAGYFKFSERGPRDQELVQKGLQGIITAKTNPDHIFNEFGDHVNILLIGRDVNWKIGKVYDPKTKKYRSYQVHDETAKARSDTMIVVALNKREKTIRMISIPRDAWVRIADNGEYDGRTKLNAAHAYGGPELLIRTLEEELGITIHRHAVIKFDGFKSLIDRVGGITVNVDGALKRKNGKLYRGNLDYDDDWGNLHVHLKPGPQKLDGAKAHGYVRFRMDIEGDPGRIRRQQQVMRALAKQMMNVPLLQLPGLIDELQKQFETDMKTDELASAATFAKNIGESSKIQPLTLFGTYYQGGSICLNKPKNIKLLSHILGPTFNEENFLRRSPTTTGDVLGPTNNASPETLELLKAAGIIGANGEGITTSGELAPVVVEPDGSTGSRETTATITEATPTPKPRKQKTPKPTPLPTAARPEIPAGDPILGGKTAREESGETGEGGAVPEVAPLPEAPAPKPE